MVAIIITTLNYYDITKQCLESMYINTDIDFETIIIDANSKDNTAERVKADFPDIRVVKSPIQLWTSHLWNLGLYSTANEDYVGIMNNDLIFNADWLEILLDTFNEYPKAGMVSAALQEKGKIVIGYCFTPTGYNFIPYKKDQVIPVSVTHGGCSIFPRDALDRVGKFDDSLILAYEENDYAFRMWDAGYQVISNAKCIVNHLGGTIIPALGGAELMREAYKIQYNLMGLPDPKQIFLKKYPYSKQVEIWEEKIKPLHIKQGIEI